MLKSIKIKDNLINTAIVELLMNIYCEQMALKNALMEDFCKRNNLDPAVTKNKFDEEVQDYRQRLLEALFAEYGDLNMDEIQNDKD